MANVGIRNRDQAWQLMLVGGAASLLLMATAIFVLTRGGDSETTASAVALNSDNADLASQLVASPSAEGDDGGGTGAGGDLRSSGVLGIEGDAEGDAGDEDSAITLEVTTSSVVESSTTVSTEAPADSVTTSSSTTSTIAEVTTSKPTTSSPSTVETTVPPPSTTEATSSTTEILITLPTNPPQRSITPEDLAKARKQWASMGYDSYSMTVKRYCFCLPGTVGSFEVVVRSNEVASVTPLDGQPKMAEDMNLQSFTVPGLFNMVERGLDASRLHVVFDNQTGVPTVMEVDHHQLMADDEMSVYVSNLRPLRGR